MDISIIYLFISKSQNLERRFITKNPKLTFLQSVSPRVFRPTALFIYVAEFSKDYSCGLNVFGGLNGDKMYCSIL